ncbi:MAG TPA: hypothetical protein VKE98_06470 [Gemmataceae bacterium]|nr:hypothetical protein [Gemmataceae bacterium]
MRHTPGLLCLVLIFLGSAGCGASGSPLPAVAQVAKIRLVVRSGQDAGCDVTLTKQPDIASVMEWLAGIDWSQQGTDLAVVSLPQPDGSIVITTNGGTTHDFSFYWDGGIIQVQANRPASM